MDHHLAGDGPLAAVVEIGGSEVHLVQQAGASAGVAPAGHPALDQLQGAAGTERQRAVVLRAVVHHGPHRLRRPGLLHHRLMLPAIVELDGGAAGLDILSDVVPGVDDAASAVILIAPGGGAVAVGLHHLCLAGTEGDDGHGAGHGELHGGGIALPLWQNIEQIGHQVLILQAQIGSADLGGALGGLRNVPVPGEAAVLQHQLHRAVRREGDLPQSHVGLLVAGADGGDLRPIGTGRSDVVPRVHTEADRPPLAGGVLELIGGSALHRASGGVWEYLGGAPGTGDSLGILQFEEPGGGEVRIAVVKEGLSCIGRTGTGQEQQGDQRPTDPPGAPGQGA